MGCTSKSRNYRELEVSVSVSISGKNVISRKNRVVNSEVVYDTFETTFGRFFRIGDSQ